MARIKEIKVLSSLEKIYDSDKMPTVGYKGFSMPKKYWTKKFTKAWVEGII